MSGAFQLRNETSKKLKSQHKVSHEHINYGFVNIVSLCIAHGYGYSIRIGRVITVSAPRRLALTFSLILLLPATNRMAPTKKAAPKKVAKKAAPAKKAAKVCNMCFGGSS